MYKRECKRERVRPHRRELWEKDEDKRGEKGKGKPFRGTGKKISQKRTGKIGMPYQKHSTTTEENTQGTGSQDDWKKEVVPRLPAQLEEQAKKRKAFERCREISSVTDLLRALLASV